MLLIKTTSNMATEGESKKRPLESDSVDADVASSSKNYKVSSPEIQWNFKKDVFDLIIQHLSKSEILNLTLVASEFNKNIGASEIFMSKVKFRINDFVKKQSRRDIREVMSHSKRNYSHFIIRAHNFRDEEFGILFKNDWLSAKIMITEVDSSQKFVKYINLLLPTLTSLELSVSEVSSTNELFKLEFTNLKHLCFTSCNSFILEHFVKDEVNEVLTSLELSAIRQSDVQQHIPPSKIYGNFIEKFTALTHLDIGSTSITDDFFRITDISECAKFHLKELRLDAPSEQETYCNIEKFLISQGASLVEICLLSWSKPSTIQNIWNKMKALKIFYMNNQKSVAEFKPVQNHLKTKRLQMLFLNFPKSECTMEFFEPLLNAIHPRLIKLQVNFAPCKREFFDLLDSAARMVIVNGEKIEYGSENESSDEATESDSRDDEFSTVEVEDSDDEMEVPEIKSGADENITENGSFLLELPEIEVSEHEFPEKLNR